MDIRRLYSASRLLTLAALATIGATAATITYSTSGDIGGVGATFHALDALMLSYTALTDATVTLPFPTNAQFGSFVVSGPSSGDSNAFNATFVLTISQSQPIPGGAEMLTGALTGRVSESSSNLILTLTDGSGGGGVPVFETHGNPITGAPAYAFNLGNTSYWIDQITPIVPSTTGSGVSVVSGAIGQAPEPGPFELMGSGLGLLLVAAKLGRGSLRSRTSPES